MTDQNMIPLLEVRNLGKRFPIEKGLFSTSGYVNAAVNISFSIHPGEVVALVGESGSGKSTVGKLIQGLLAPTQGEILFSGRHAESITRRERAHLVQMIFQDPFASLNPRISVGAMLEEAIRQTQTDGYPSAKIKEEIERLLTSVGLSMNILYEYAHQFSGGQRQRLGIARALAMKPQLIIADEPVSALDISIQAQILNLLMDLQDEFGISYLLISHDLSVIEQLADKVMVMRNGEIVEEGSVEHVFSSPKTEYTQTLLSAVLTL